MGIILGIDIGGTTTKIVGLDSNGIVLSMLRVRAEDQLTSLYGALGNYLTNNQLALQDIARIVLTGVGASQIESNIYGIPTCKVDEFRASGLGGLSLSDMPSAVVVTMGTGTAFLYADQDGSVEHLCGSGIGGGTLSGLCHRMVGVERYSQIRKMAEHGDLERVDLTIGELTAKLPDTLRPDMTASNFGHLAEDATSADLAAGAVNLVLQAIGTMTVLACRSSNCNNVILTGSLTTLPQLTPAFELFESLYDIHYMVPEHATFATAIGAALCSLRKQTI